ncbi:hypothetical protein CQA38_06970 [Campylobacter sp. MIT 12-5580]|uniref:major outer membrane protein n=1 Tax=Campylobacter sp. MIT 12-5580 TaxID=2040651 RepID=UPI0010F51FF5|nr:major outer membrane protein [Campylobacter sp. MIT 12-5580]TKX28615.1 hypothetical protein CQA38_06970 [Campylobacter sp. MIT 12-5580]
MLRLSLVLVLFVCAFHLHAKSLEESIKDVELNTYLRYRYESNYKTGDLTKLDSLSINPFPAGKRTPSNSQRHRYLAYFNLGFKLDEYIKLGSQLSYKAGRNVSEQSYGPNASVNTTESFSLRQAYMLIQPNEYTHLSLGRQVVGNFWTNSAQHDGLVGMGAKFSFDFEGVNLNAFAWDSLDINDGDTILDRYDFDEARVENFFAKNWYGASMQADFLNFKSLLNFSFLQDRALLYALDLKYKFNFDNDLTYTIHGQFAGNNIQDYLERRAFNNARFFALQGVLKLQNFDFRFGGLMYGDKEKRSFHSIEDGGKFIFAGEEALSSIGSSNYSAHVGRNLYGFAVLGYTLDKMRFGFDFVHGGTQTSSKLLGEIARLGGGKKTEYVARFGYKLSKKFDFLTYYSLVQVRDISIENQAKSSYDNKKIRLQLLYRF